MLAFIVDALHSHKFITKNESKNGQQKLPMHLRKLTAILKSILIFDKPVKTGFFYYMLRSIKYEVYSYNDWVYEHYEYAANQHKYTKTEEGSILPRKSEGYEFNKAKLYGTEVQTKIRKAS